MTSCLAACGFPRILSASRRQSLVARCIAGLSALVAIFVSSPGALAQLILLDARGGFDASHNLASGSGFARLRDEITTLGFQYAPIASFESANLQGAAAVLLLQPYSPAAAYTSSEISALASFASHAGLLLMADGGSGSSADYLNALSTGFGVTYASTATEPLGAGITQFSSHSLTAGLSSIMVDYQRRLTIAAPAFDLSTGSGANDFAAVVGRAVFVSDSSIFMDPDQFSDASIASGSNGRFVDNVLLTVVPEPSAFAPAVLLLLGAFGIRLHQGRKQKRN